MSSVSIAPEEEEVTLSLSSVRRSRRRERSDGTTTSISTSQDDSNGGGGEGSAGSSAVTPSVGPKPLGAVQILAAATGPLGKPAVNVASAQQTPSIAERRQEIHEFLTVTWATGCLLCKQFAVSLIQHFPNGAHNLKTMFFSDFDRILEGLAAKDASSMSTGHGGAAHFPGRATGKSRWGQMASKRRQIVGAMTGAILSSGGDFIAPDDAVSGFPVRATTGRRGAERTTDANAPDLGMSDDDDDVDNTHRGGGASSTVLASHFSHFDRVAAAMVVRSAARKLLALGPYQFVNNALRLLLAHHVISENANIENHDMQHYIDALRWRQTDGLGLRAPIGDDEDPTLYLSDDEEEGGNSSLRDEIDAEAYFAESQNRERRSAMRWMRELRERWFTSRSLPAVEGQLNFFANPSVLCFCLLDLYFNANPHGFKKSLHWNTFVEYLGDCGSSGGGAPQTDEPTASQDAKSAGGAAAAAGGESAESGSVGGSGGAVDLSTRAMLEAVTLLPFDDVSRTATLTPWLARGLLIAREIRRDDSEHLLFFDSSVLRPNRTFAWPAQYGRIAHVEVATSLNALAVATFDVVRVIDADNYVCKFMYRSEDPVTALRWIDECSMLVIGNRSGTVVSFELAELDQAYFGGGSQVITEWPIASTHEKRRLHEDAIAHISDHILPTGKAIVVSSLDGTLSLWSLESSMVRKMIGGVALGFQVLSSLGLIFAFGVDLFPMAWSYTVANSKPILIGSQKKGARPHQARIIGVSALEYPKNSGFSLDRLGGVKVWDLWEMHVLQEWSLIDHIPPSLGTRGIAFSTFYLSTSGQYMYVYSPKLLSRVAFVRPEDIRKAPVASTAPVAALCYCPELRLFLSAHRNSVTVWNSVTAGPITTFDNISPAKNDEILLMEVYETPYREFRVGTKLGLVVTVSIGNGSIRHVHRHVAKKEIQCFLYIPMVETLVVSSDRCAKSVLHGDEKNFTLVGRDSVGFSDVCIHRASMLLLAAHEDQVRWTIWDLSPTTPNVWIRLCDVNVPVRFLDLSLAVSKGSSSSRSRPANEDGGGTEEGGIGCAKLHDCSGTPFFVVADSTSQMYFCQLDITVDGERDFSVDEVVAGDTGEEGDDGSEEDVRLRDVRRRFPQRRKSTLTLRTTAAAAGSLYDEESPRKTGGGSSASAQSPQRSRVVTTRASNGVRRVRATVRQICPHRLHNIRDSGLKSFVPSIASMRYLHKFALLYVADDAGFVTVYDVADVLLHSAMSPALSRHSSGGSLSSAGMRPVVSTREMSRASRGLPKTDSVATTFQNTRPTNINEPVLAEQIWGKTDMPFAPSLDDRLHELKAVFSTMTTGRVNATSTGVSETESRSAESLSSPLLGGAETFNVDFLISCEGPLSGTDTATRRGDSSASTSFDVAEQPPLLPDLSRGMVEPPEQPPNNPHHQRFQVAQGLLTFNPLLEESCGDAIPEPLAATVAPHAQQSGKTSGGPAAVARRKSGDAVQPRHRLASGGGSGGPIPILTNVRTRKVKFATVTPAPARRSLDAPAAQMSRSSSIDDDKGLSSSAFFFTAFGGDEDSKPAIQGGNGSLTSPSAASAAAAAAAAVNFLKSPKSAAAERFKNAAADLKGSQQATPHVGKIAGPHTRKASTIAVPSNHSSNRNARRDDKDEPDSVVVFSGDVFFVERVECHPGACVSSLLILPEPLSSVATCGSDRQISMWTLYLKHVGRLTLATDTRQPLYEKLKVLAPQIMPLPTNSRSNVQRRRSRSRRQSVAPATDSGVSAAQEAAEWMRAHCVNAGDRLSAFDDVPKRFRTLARNPVADWQFECDRILDVGGDTMGGGGTAISFKDEEAIRQVMLPTKPELVNWTFYYAQRGGGGSLNAADDSNPDDDASILLGLSAAAAAAPPTSSSGARDARPAGVFITSPAPLEEQRAGAESAAGVTPPHSGRRPRRDAQDLRLTHEDKVVMYQEWLFGQFLTLSDRGGRHLDRIQALKQLKESNLDDVVNRALVEREDREALKADEERRAQGGAHRARSPVPMTKEMQLLFGATFDGDEGVRTSMMSASGGMNEATQRRLSPPKQRNVLVADGEALSATDERQLPEDKGFAREDEAWLSRMVLKQLEPPKKAFVVPTTVMIERKLEDNSNARAHSPPTRARQFHREALEQAQLLAVHSYKQRVADEADRDDRRRTQYKGLDGGIGGAESHRETPQLYALMPLPQFRAEVLHVKGLEADHDRALAFRPSPQQQQQQHTALLHPKCMTPATLLSSSVDANTVDKRRHTAQQSNSSTAWQCSPMWTPPASQTPPPRLELRSVQQTASGSQRSIGRDRDSKPSSGTSSFGATDSQRRMRAAQYAKRLFARTSTTDDSSNAVEDGFLPSIAGPATKHIR